MKLSKIGLASVVTAAACTAALQLSAAVLLDEGGEWRSYGSTIASTKYSPLDQINAGNVKELQIAWRWKSPASDLKSETLVQWVYEATPLMVDEVLYSSTPASQAVAMDARTGETRWVHDPGSFDAGTASHFGLLIHRGVSYWEDGEDKRIIYGTSDGYLIALNAKTGVPIPSFGDGGRVDLTKGLRRPIQREHYSVSSPPVIVGDVAVVAHLRAEALRLRQNDRRPGPRNRSSGKRDRSTDDVYGWRETVHRLSCRRSLSAE